MFGEIEEMLDEVEKRFNRFKNFEVIDYPPQDHKFNRFLNFDVFVFDYPQQEKKTRDSSSILAKRIEQELSILEKNIPDWVFVRSYKNRRELMRAAIIGPPNTPYHHCLFFFDIEFPGNYPSKPPKIHYQSYGIDLNPNLHLDGSISLQALLETRFDYLSWSGKSNKEGRWDPEESNMLHVFHAIRSTILDKLHDAPEKKKRKVFVLACEKMIRVLNEPPSEFRDFVLGYFRKRAHWVLLLFRENKYNDSLLMIDMFVRMYKVFVSNGAYCKHHLCFLRSIEQEDCRMNVEAKIRELEEF